MTNARRSKPVDLNGDDLQCVGCTVTWQETTSRGDTLRCASVVLFLGSLPPSGVSQARVAGSGPWAKIRLVSKRSHGQEQRQETGKLWTSSES